MPGVLGAIVLDLRGPGIQLLSETDAAYIAGLVDGEGTITLTRKHRNENQQLCVSISSTERQLREFVLNISGVVKITNKRTTSARHAPSFTFAVYNRQALDLIKQILPWLKSYKLQRAALILQDYIPLTPRNGKYSQDLRDRRSAFVEQVLSIKANSAID